MKHKIMVLYLISFLCAAGSLLYLHKRTSSISATDSLPESEAADAFYYINYREAMTGNDTVTLCFSKKGLHDGLAIMFENISSFTVYDYQGQIVYSCSEKDLSRQSYVIPIEQRMWNGDVLTLTVRTPYFRRLTSIAIGSYDTLLSQSQQWDTLSVICIVLESTLILICMILYLAKPSETYLASLSLLILISLLTRLISNELTNRFFSHEINKYLLPSLGLLPLFPELFLLIRFLNIRPPSVLAWLTSMRRCLVLSVLICLTGILLPDRATECILTISCILFAITLCLLWHDDEPKEQGAVFLAACYGINLGILSGHCFLNLASPVHTLASYNPTTVAFLFYSFGSCTYVLLRFARGFACEEKMREELEELNVKLDEKAENRAKALVAEKAQKHRLMLNVFHDLRTPLYIAEECVHAIQEPAEDREEYLSILSDRLDFMKHLTEDLFLIAKLEDHDFMMVFDRVNLSVICKEQCQSAALMAAEHHISLTSSLTPDVLVWGDSYRLEQTLQNLLTNAVTYTPDYGSITVSLTSDGSFCYLSVADNGKGIAPEDLPDIFSRYYQVDRAQNHKSTGLGLSIAYEIVKAHRGELTVTSEIGKGTVFTAKLPLQTL